MMMEGKLFLAPIGDNPQRCLDVGTGTGIWAMYVVLPPLLAPMTSSLRKSL